MANIYREVATCAPQSANGKVRLEEAQVVPNELTCASLGCGKSEHVISDMSLIISTPQSSLEILVHCISRIQADL